MKTKKILIIGHLALNANVIDGQTIKSKNIYKLCQKYINKIYLFDTYYKLNIKNYINLFSGIFNVKTVIFLPGKNNLLFFFPILFFLSKIFNFKIIYIVIGGWLDTFVSKHKFHKYLLKNIKIILLENKSLLFILKEQYKFKNCDILPNFKFYSFKDSFKNCNKNKFNIVFCARIIPEKGIDYILYFADYIKTNNILNIDIDFYGPIDQSYSKIFFENIKKYNFIRYKGIIDYELVTAYLKNYQLLVLPSYYLGEGFPGTIIDAYNSSLPVIVSNWKFLPEYVEHGKSGFIFNLNNKDEFVEYIMILYNNKDLLYNMKKYCKKKAKEFSIHNISKILFNYIE